LLIIGSLPAYKYIEKFLDYYEFIIERTGMNMKTPILQTERLLLRPLKLEDAEHIFKSWSSDPETVKYMQWDVHTSINDTERWLSAEEEAIESDENYTWGFELKNTRSLIGSGGICYNTLYNMFEIGYIIMRQYWGQGITSEAVKRIIAFAKEELGLKMLYAKHAKDNPASGRVLQKQGFVYQKENKYAKFSGSEEFDCKEYFLEL